uniref:Uncharacterized protein n=1 Tax=Anguilla anguilla TaxID=7936 RepID=A0A0E9PJR4_ANGAN
MHAETCRNLNSHCPKRGITDDYVYMMKQASGVK